MFIFSFSLLFSSLRTFIDPIDFRFITFTNLYKIYIINLKILLKNFKSDLETSVNRVYFHLKVKNLNNQGMISVKNFFHDDTHHFKDQKL